MVALFGVPATVSAHNPYRRVATIEPLTPEDSWALTRILSPRPAVRAAALDASGMILNIYASEHATADTQPATTWAMYLADEDYRFHYICFDLDAKSGNAQRDAEKLSHWLDELNIEHVVTISGPSGGRHVWVSLETPTEGHTVKLLGQLAKQLLPSLDESPLRNPAYGCVRPPGAPHRAGGASQPIRGTVDILNRNSTLDEQLDQLRDMLIDLGAEIELDNIVPLHGQRIDEDGFPFIPGQRRPLSARILALLDDDPADEDMSRTLMTVLTAMAHARFTYTDMLDHLPSPAFEHVRTFRSGTYRQARPADKQRAVLQRNWRLAVEYVLTHPVDTAGMDLEFYERLHGTVTTVSEALDRADAMPGYFGTDRTPARAEQQRSLARKAVFSAVLLFMLQAGRTSVEADIRRISEQTGYGRSTVHRALQELTRPRDGADTESAWLVKVGEPSGRLAQRYTLPERFSTEEHPLSGTQVTTRPPATSLRTILSTRILKLLKPLASDTFAAPHSLGRTAGLIYGLLPHPDDGATAATIASRVGLTWASTVMRLEQLKRVGLAVQLDDRSWAVGPGSLTAVAVHLDVVGYLADRRDRYSRERGVWAWWCAEVVWMTSRRGNKGKRKRPTAELALFAVETDSSWPRYPRGPDKSPDHRTARLMVTAGLMSTDSLSLAA